MIHIGCLLNICHADRHTDRALEAKLRVELNNYSIVMSMMPMVSSRSELNECT